MAAEAAEVFAPAKINLCLHVVGRRDDGYHELDSIVAFADIGDSVRARSAPAWSLTVTGPFGRDLAGDGDNLVLRAARLTAGPPAALTLCKRLPVASGIGGGSADAAATLRALAQMDGRPIPDDVLRLGADVPACLAARTARLRGIGERLDEIPPLPPLFLCLVNPGRQVATPAVFGALADPVNAPLPDPPAFADAAAAASWLAAQRNDLEAPARALEPAIGTVLARLQASLGCRLARMSGSGATCFGLFDTRPEARFAAHAIAAERPGWWVRVGVLT